MEESPELPQVSGDVLATDSRRALVSVKTAGYLTNLAAARNAARAPQPSRKLMGEFLLDALKISREQLEDVLAEQAQTRELLGEILLRRGLVSQEEIGHILQIQKGIVFVDVRSIDIPNEVLLLIPEHIIRRHKILPIEHNRQKLTIGMVHPENLVALELLRFRFKNTLIEPVRIEKDAFSQILATRFKDLELDDRQPLVGELEEIIITEGEDLDSLRGDAGRLNDVPIIKVANGILAQAMRKKASDIHLEPGEQELVLRYRVDGVLYKDQTLSVSIQLPLVSRFKIMANMDIAEKRLPQDGRFRLRIGDKNIDVRVNSMPSKYGEKLCMRILDKSTTKVSLKKLIILPEMVEVLRTLMSRPNGIIFVTGPTGSGKTTTLYAMLSELNKDTVNIVTTEDPIEYELQGLTQVQIKPEIGLTFSSILRGFLRQDPDIIMIGETRDKEVARIAIEAALTGHLVFTSLHTNDAPGAITRLQEMGIEGFLVAATTVAVINQRVVRELCMLCRELYEPTVKELELVGEGHRAGNHVEWYRATGCEYCVSGYKGRIGIYEVMVMNDELRDLVAQGATKAMLRYAAKQAGMMTLKEYALRCINWGLTSFEELLRVIYTNEGVEKFCSTCRNIVGEEFLKCPYCQNELRKVCPNCQRAVNEGWISCPACGQMLLEMPTDRPPCRHCTLPLESTWKFCPECGSTRVEEHHCASCKRLLQPGWTGCPYCWMPTSTQA